MCANLGHTRENNYFSELGFCCLLIKNFLQEYCDGNVENLITFPFSKIISSKKYGDIGKRGGKKKTATIENTQLAKAIFFLLYGEMLPELAVDVLFSYKSNKISPYRARLIFQRENIFGDDETLKTFNNVFADDKYLQFRKRLESFHFKLQTIGNFVLLHREMFNIEINCCDNINEDMSYACKVLFEGKTLNFQKIFLNPQDDNLKNIFVQDVMKYIEKVEKIIDQRANNICLKIKEKIK